MPLPLITTADSQQLTETEAVIMHSRKVMCSTPIKCPCCLYFHVDSSSCIFMLFIHPFVPGLIPEALETKKGCGIHASFQKFDTVSIVLMSWAFKRSISRNRVGIFNFENI
jgi:hypothetical protein